MAELGSLFSGIGGLELGLEAAGVGQVRWQVERDPYCRSVLARHWPSAERFDDVHAVGKATLVSVGTICGGFPCQPVSVAGKRLGDRDERWLWPQFRRVIEEVGPGAVIAENVPGLRNAGLRVVLADLADLGFDAEWATVSAFELGAPHIRKRIFIVATHPMRVNVQEQPGWLGRAIESARAPVTGDALEEVFASNSDGQRPEAERGALLAPNGDKRRRPADPNSLRRLEQSWRLATKRGWPQHRGWRFDSTPRVDDVPSRGLVGAQRRAAGNAVVAACSYAVGRAFVGATQCP